MVRIAAHADVFHAVADCTRRRMLDLLAERERPVGEFVETFHITQPSVSQHLRVLREAGLVTARRRGRLRIYRLNARPIQEVFDWAAYFERFWDERLDRLGRYLSTGRKPSKRKKQ